MTQPVRLQLSRRKGFNLQALSRETNGLEAVVVTRASKKWGNPYYIGLFRGYGRADAVRDFKKWIDGDRGARDWSCPYSDRGGTSGRTKRPKHRLHMPA